MCVKHIVVLARFIIKISYCNLHCQFACLMLNNDGKKYTKQGWQHIYKSKALKVGNVNEQ